MRGAPVLMHTVCGSRYMLVASTQYPCIWQGNSGHSWTLRFSRPSNIPRDHLRGGLRSGRGSAATASRVVRLLLYILTVIGVSKSLTTVGCVRGVKTLNWPPFQGACGSGITTSILYGTPSRWEEPASILSTIRRNSPLITRTRWQPAQIEGVNDHHHRSRR